MIHVMNIGRLVSVYVLLLLFTATLCGQLFAQACINCDCVESDRFCDCDEPGSDCYDFTLTTALGGIRNTWSWFGLPQYQGPNFLRECTGSGRCEGVCGFLQPSDNPVFSNCGDDIAHQWYTCEVDP